MFNNLKKIKSFAVSSGLVLNPKVSFFEEDYNVLNYLIEENGQKLVLRIKKDAEPEFKDSLERKHVFLKYFESKKIGFCPKSFFYDKKTIFPSRILLKEKKFFKKIFHADKLICL